MQNRKRNLHVAARGEQLAKQATSKLRGSAPRPASAARAWGGGAPPPADWPGHLLWGAPITN